MMNRKELNIWAYFNEIEYCLQDENYNKERALYLISIARHSNWKDERRL